MDNHATADAVRRRSTPLSILLPVGLPLKLPYLSRLGRKRERSIPYHPADEAIISFQRQAFIVGGLNRKPNCVASVFQEVIDPVGSNLIISNNDYRWSSDLFGYDDRSNFINEDSTSCWNYDGEYGGQWYSYEHSYGSYVYTNEMGSYNHEWSASYSTYDA